MKKKLLDMIKKNNKEVLLRKFTSYELMSVMETGGLFTIIAGISSGDNNLIIGGMGVYSAYKNTYN